MDLKSDFTASPSQNTANRKLEVKTKMGHDSAVVTPTDIHEVLKKPVNRNLIVNQVKSKAFIDTKNNESSWDIFEVADLENLLNDSFDWINPFDKNYLSKDKSSPKMIMQGARFCAWRVIENKETNSSASDSKDHDSVRLSDDSENEEYYPENQCSFSPHHKIPPIRESEEGKICGPYCK